MLDQAKLDVLRERIRHYQASRDAFMLRLERRIAAGEEEIDDEIRQEGDAITAELDSIKQELAIATKHNDNYPVVTTVEQVAEFCKTHESVFGSEHRQFSMTAELPIAPETELVQIWFCNCGAGIRFVNKILENGLTIGSQAIILSHGIQNNGNG